MLSQAIIVPSESEISALLLQIAQLNSLINMLLGELNPGDRQKIMTLCTIDVHARDVVSKLIAQKVGSCLLHLVNNDHVD